ncbi:MAG TPA: hypothetical protein EYH05_06430, partial [Anaerolineae bacterium]|nr:hypothetical protein [Anaerolineae bacterium]
MSKLLLDFTDVLAECIEAIEQDRMTLADCLARYPEYAADLEALLPVMTEMRTAPPVSPSLAFRQEARQHLLRQLPPIPNENVTFFQALRHSWQNIGLFQPTRRVSMTWIIIIATVVSIFAGGGAAAYAADAAVPGDPLYALDLTLEEMRLSLASTPEARVTLQLAFAEERLEEAQALAAANDTTNLPEALTGYGEAIAAIAQTVGTTEEAGQEALMALVDQSLAVHDTVLADLLLENVMTAGDMGQKPPEQELPEQPGDGQMGDARCSVISENPVAEQIAARFDVSAEEVMNYFCDSAGFGEIMLAYNISEQTGIPVNDLLALREEGLGWGQIMQDLDLIGRRPDDAGIPDDTDLPDTDTPQDPPDDASKPEDTPDKDDNPGNTPQDPPGDDSGNPGNTPPQDPPGDDGGNPGDAPPQDPPGDDGGNPGDAPPQDPPGDDSGNPGDTPPQDPPGDDSGNPGDTPPQDPPGDD